jgi:hypothetical protein
MSDEQRERLLDTNICANYLNALKHKLSNILFH